MYIMKIRFVSAESFQAYISASRFGLRRSFSSALILLALLPDCTPNPGYCENAQEKHTQIARSWVVLCAANPEDRELCSIAALYAVVPFECK